MAIYFYQASKHFWKPACCRFYPSCSNYALEALDKYSLCKALWLIISRISRCHPLAHAGYDPLPETLTNTKSTSNENV